MSTAEVSSAVAALVLCRERGRPAAHSEASPGRAAIRILRMQVILIYNEAGQRDAHSAGDPVEAGLEETSHLSRGTRLLIRALRRLVVGQNHCPLVAREFATACGEDAPEVFASFGTFLCTLAFSGRRRLSVGHPGDSRLTGDEKQLVAMLALAQSSDGRGFEASVRRLSRADARHEMMMAAGALAAAFAAHGLHFHPAPPVLIAIPGGKGDRAPMSPLTGILPSPRERQLRMVWSKDT